MNDRLAETWSWFIAIYAFDYADPKPLSELIRSEPIPPEYIDAVADIVAGERPIKRKAAAQFPKSLPAAKRMQIAAGLNTMSEIRDFLLSSPQHTENVADAQREFTPPVLTWYGIKPSRVSTSASCASKLLSKR
jgi:hypothetical protein